VVSDNRGCFRQLGMGERRLHQGTSRKCQRVIALRSKTAAGRRNRPSSTSRRAVLCRMLDINFAEFLFHALG
jgi:hypothetical protein